MLETTILRHRDISNQLQEKRDALLSLIQHNASDSIQNKGRDSFNLPDFLVVHYSIADLERAALRSHWDDWINIQQDIIGLGVEILGPEGVSGAGGGLPAYVIRDAASDFGKHTTVSNAYDQKTNKGIRNLARNTQRQLVVQEKVIVSMICPFDGQLSNILDILPYRNGEMIRRHAESKCSS